MYCRTLTTLINIVIYMCMYISIYTYIYIHKSINANILPNKYILHCRPAAATEQLL